MRVLITGAAGNLGTFLARFLLAEGYHFLNLMIHEKPLADELAQGNRTRIYSCDLGQPHTLVEVCAASDVIVHFAGMLFAPRPEKFLPRTNFVYTKHLVDAAIAGGVKRFILVSFPHVEGPTSVEDPCTDRQDREPVSVHARTRLAAEKYLLEKGKESGMRTIALRPGMIYGRDVLMIAFAKKLARKNLLAVWTDPTAIQLLSLDDFNACCKAAIENSNAEGIYPLGDDCPTTLQDFLDTACRYWGLGRPWRAPAWSIYLGAWLCETFAIIFRTHTPFTVDLIRISRVPYYCDTSRMKAELLPELKYPSLQSQSNSGPGIQEL
ncbi:MAG: NAD(P)-dependent oxidoreductase [Acidobacteria bacterium]|nr:NAD(P)-dependent oxidoreductase [Acidobacteriota bacterium]